MPIILFWKMRMRLFFRDKAEINVRFEIVKFALDDQKNVGIAGYFEAFLGSITQIFTSQIGQLFRPHPLTDKY